MKKLTFGEKCTDIIANFGGSWIFIIIQTIVVSIWIILNISGYFSFDLYPFILLNLAFSLQAAYSAPIILMAANRQARIDRKRDENDYKLDVDTNIRIKDIHKKIDLLLTKLE